jgi:drug/metabolite transporter (DMT)-like permease
LFSSTLPIGILLLACGFQWLERSQKFSTLRTATSIALLIGMICAILAALTGYLLSFSGDYDEGLVITHQWFGISVARCKYCDVLFSQQGCAI